MVSFDRPVVDATTSTTTNAVRVAGPEDINLVRAIDREVFPGGIDLQPAPLGELERGIEAGHVYVLEAADGPVAYLHVDQTRSDRVYIAGLGVLPERQGAGFGSRLLQHAHAIVDPLRDKLPVYTVTSPYNVVMQQILFAHGFAGRWILRDHFGPDRHRVGYQLLRTGAELPETDGLPPVPAQKIDDLAALVAEGRVIRRLRRGSEDPELELVRADAAEIFLPCDPPDPHPT